MKKLLLSISAVAFLASCSVNFKPVNNLKRDYNDVSLNTQLVSEIGDKLIEKGTEYYQKAYRIENTPSFTVGMVAFPYKNGEVLPLMGTNGDYNLYFVPSASANNQYQIGISENTKTGEVLPFTNSVNGFSRKKVDGFKAVSDEYRDSSCSECFKREFIYDGKSGNSAKFIYREYVNDLARPAFNQDLVYDLNESNIVGFKGLRIEVIKSTNTSIEYKVLSSFN